MWVVICYPVIDYADKSVKVLNLKRKPFDQIVVAMEELGDQQTQLQDTTSSLREDWTSSVQCWVPLQVLKCKPRELEEWEKDLVANLKSMDDVLPRPTADAQLELLRRLTSNEGEVADEVSEEFDVS